jgi:hypothetical protein
MCFIVIIILMFLLYELGTGANISMTMPAARLKAHKRQQKDTRVHTKAELPDGVFSEQKS